MLFHQHFLLDVFKVTCIGLFPEQVFFGFAQGFPALLDHLQNQFLVPLRMLFLHIASRLLAEEDEWTERALWSRRLTLTVILQHFSARFRGLVRIYDDRLDCVFGLKNSMISSNSDDVT